MAVKKLIFGELPESIKKAIKDDIFLDDVLELIAEKYCASGLVYGAIVGIRNMVREIIIEMLRQYLRPDKITDFDIEGVDVHNIIKVYVHEEVNEIDEIPF